VLNSASNVVSTLTIGNNNATAIFGGAIRDNTAGAGCIMALTKIGGGTQTLTGADTYSGNTLVTGGTLAVNGTLASSPVTVANSATLSCNGVIGGNVTVSAGGTVSPGGTGAIGAMTISNNLTLQGNAWMDVNPATLTNDVIRAHTITFGGTLTVTNISATLLAAGNSFKLFVASNYSGAFNAINPPTPGAGLAWNSNNLGLNGTLSVVSVPSRPGITGVRLSGTNLVINATNGMTGETNYVLMTTNLTTPLNQWTPVATNVLAGSGNFTITVTNAFNTNAPQHFYNIEVQ